MKKIKIKGKETCDDTQVIEFLENMVEQKILPKLSKEALVPQKAGTDDLPF